MIYTTFILFLFLPIGEKVRGTVYDYREKNTAIIEGDFPIETQLEVTRCVICEDVKVRFIGNSFINVEWSPLTPVEELYRGLKNLNKLKSIRRLIPTLPY